MKQRIAVSPGLVVVALLALGGRTVDAQSGISNTVHNLSVGGPGLVRAVSDQRVCVFCHAPHNTGGATPLWNRSDPTTNYIIYGSSTLDAQPGQPVGVSKYCLSCHDGTIALGAVMSESTAIQMAGSQFIDGSGNLGTDLSDDHPISFHYGSGLAAADPQIVDPALLSPQLSLPGGRLECTTCHDPHNNLYGDFLVLDPESGALCASCHQMTGWTSSSHRLSAATMPAGQLWSYPTVQQNACRGCHVVHGAGHGERLLAFQEEEQNCLKCHNGLTTNYNIAAELAKSTHHDPTLFLGLHDPVETYYGGQAHVECSDCHNPHAVESNLVLPFPNFVTLGATMKHSRGFTIGGSPIADAQYEYEICLRCHGDTAVNVLGRITRLADSDNLRLDFSPGNPSFHPVAFPSVNPDVPSLRAGITPGTLIRCTDCHNNDQTRRTGGAGPDGPHGSIYDFLLEKNYTTTDPNNESAFHYALCYKCHDRTSILDNDSFDEHKKHIDDENTPCSVCHDPHGIGQGAMTGSDHTHLINFDLSVVFPEPTSGKLEFRDLGRFRGSCTLRCHGEDHEDEDY